MLTVNVLCVGTLKEQYLRDAINEYSKRIGGYAKLVIRETKNDRELIPLIKEKKGYKIALCVEGKQMSSEELSASISSLASMGESHLVFIIGGSHGLSDSVKLIADFRLSMSEMTFPHQLARVMLLEQIYRAYQISTGGKYHK